MRPLAPWLGLLLAAFLGASRDPELSALEHKLAEVSAAAVAAECAASGDVPACEQREYKRRIAELQARYRLVPARGPFRWKCDGNPASEVVVTFFDTDPATLVAQRGDSVAVMIVQPSGSGAKYEGRDESFWEHHHEAAIRWGFGAAELHCTRPH